MAEGETDDVGDVRVGDGVHIVAAGLSSVNQTCQLELRQVLTHRWDGLPDFGGQGSDVALVLTEQPQDLKAGGSGEHAENCCRVV